MYALKVLKSACSLYICFSKSIGETTKIGQMLQTQPQCLNARYSLSAEPLKFPLASPRVGGPCEMVLMCCRALTEWNMSAQCHRQQALCLVISLPCSSGAAFCLGGIFLPHSDRRPGLDVDIMLLDLSHRYCSMFHTEFVTFL